MTIGKAVKGMHIVHPYPGSMVQCHDPDVDVLHLACEPRSLAIIQKKSLRNCMNDKSCTQQYLKLRTTITGCWTPDLRAHRAAHARATFPDSWQACLSKAEGNHAESEEDKRKACKAWEQSKEGMQCHSAGTSG